MTRSRNGIEEAVLTLSIFGNKRRNSSATAARLRSTDEAVGRVIGEACLQGGTIEQNRNKAKPTFSVRRDALRSDLANS
jgi:hypothetical protein